MSANTSNSKPVRKKKRTSHNYIDKEVLLAQVLEYRNDYLNAKEKGLKPPPMKEPLALSIYTIAQNLTKHPRFSGYSFREDMAIDGVENCIKYIHNFNPEKSTNAFAYISQICKFAYFRRIKIERTQTLVKTAIVMNSGILDSGIENHEYDDADHEVSFLKYLQSTIDQKALENETYYPTSENDAIADDDLGVDIYEDDVHIDKFVEEHIAETDDISFTDDDPDDQDM